MHSRIRIGQLAERAAVNAKTIRYYEQLGLMPEPPRSAGGYRLYDGDDEERLRFITRARRAGFRLGEIKEMLALRDRGEAPCTYVREVITSRQQELDRQIEDLTRLRQDLAKLERRAGALPARTDAAYCHILRV